MRRAILLLTLLSIGRVTVSADYVEDRQAASALMAQGKYAEALTAFSEMAEGDVTDFQKSDALEQAAACARRLKQFERAMGLASRIPLRAVAGTVRMQNLLAMRKSQVLIEEFKDEPLDTWPFWIAGEAYYARGRGFCDAGNGRDAEVDLNKALSFTTDDRARADVWLVLGRNREENLKDDARALEAYRQIVDMPKHRGSATYYRGILGSARILRRDGKNSEAIATLRKVDIHALRGYWHGALLVALADTLAATEQTDEALAVYREVLSDEDVTASDLQAAKEAIRAIEDKRQNGR